MTRRHVPCLAEVRSSRGWATMCALRNGHGGCHANGPLRWLDGRPQGWLQ